MVHVLTELTMDAVLAQDLDTDLMCPFTVTKVDMEPLHVRKIIYLPVPLVGLFLERDIMPTEAWTHIRGAIVDGEQEVDFWPILDWLIISLTKKVGNDKSTLAMPQPTIPMANGYLLRHHHQMLNRSLPGMEPSLQSVQGLHIATHAREVAAKLREYREAKAQGRKAYNKKGIPDLLGTNLTYLLRPGQVSAHKDPPLIWKEVVGVPKLQLLMMLQRALDDTACCLSVRAHIVTTPSLSKLTLALDVCLYHRDNLVTGLHQFGLVQNTCAAQKVLKPRANQHQVIACGGAYP